MSCVKVIDLPSKSFKPQVVVVGILNPDSLLSVRLSYSQRPDTLIKYQAINEAKVLFYEDETLIGELTQGRNGLFQLNYKPLSGKKYGLKISVVNQDDIFAEDIVPPRPIASIFKSPNNPNNPNSNPDYKLQIRSSLSSHYWIGAYSSVVYNIVTPDLLTFKFPSHLNLNIISNNPYLDRFNSFFDGLSGRYNFGDPVRIDMTTFRLEANALIDFSTTNKIPRDQKGFIYVYSVSDNYDQYLKSAIMSYQNRLFDSSGAFNNPFAEPTPIYSNIKNGLGIWAAYSIGHLSI